MFANGLKTTISRVVAFVNDGTTQKIARISTRETFYVIDV